MSGPTGRKIWQALVGLTLGSIAAQTLGFVAIVLYQAAHGNFRWEIHLFALSWRERLFIAGIPILSAILLWRKRLYVSLGMLACALIEWFLTAPWAQ
jgi:hypothetical protein